MTKELIIVVLILAILYLYHQNKKLKGLPTTGNSETIYELDERSLSAFDKDEEDLIADKDEALRKKNEAEQEVLSLSNKLKLKNQEVNSKESEIARIKKEKNEAEISLNKKITEWKEKYTRKTRQLDNADLENNKLEEKIEQLQEEIKKLKKGNLPGSK